jgi:chlorophyll synthase
MARLDLIASPPLVPALRAVLELLKPVTWFAPMWAFMCGVVSSGIALETRGLVLLGGIMLAGPLVCATSQAVNDWFDRHVDAINEPGRPIPSGRIPGQWGLWIAIVWSLVSLLCAAFLGMWVFWAATVGLVLSWAYSAPPLRLKQSGWWGPASVALSYEGITWFAGAAAMSGALPDQHILALAGLYSAGAFGIMTLNDFKAIDGDRQMGIRSLPVVLGVDNAANLACTIMAAPQVVVIAALSTWGRPVFAAAVAVSLAAQIALMVRLLRDPRQFAPWYNATGTSLYVLGMLIAAFAIRTLVGGFV